MRNYEIDAPLFPVLPRPLQERLAPGIVQALLRWTMRGDMSGEPHSDLSRHTGGRI
jgi:hypothetical protein